MPGEKKITLGPSISNFIEDEMLNYKQVLVNPDQNQGLNSQPESITALAQAQILHDSRNYVVTVRQHQNLHEIFHFYSILHQKPSNISKSFEEISSIHSRMQQSDFLKFCKDFEIPLSRTDQLEVYRKVVVKQKHKQVDFETFEEILKELFFVKEIETYIRQIYIDLKEDKDSRHKEELLNLVETLQMAQRNPANDAYYIYLAHKFLETANRPAYTKKMKNLNGKNFSSEHQKHSISNTDLEKSKAQNLRFDQMVQFYFEKKK